MTKIRQKLRKKFDVSIFPYVYDIYLSSLLFFFFFKHTRRILKISGNPPP